MRIKIGFLIPLALAALVVTGCKKEPSLVGKWNGTAQGQSALIEFKEDKTVSVEVNAMGAKIVLTGEYKQDGKNLSMTLKDSKLSGVPPQLEAMVKEGVKGALNKETKSTLEFVSEDEVNLTVSAPADPKATGTMGKDGKAETPAAPKTTTEKLTRVKDKA